MAKIPRNYRISEEVDALLKAEAARLTTANGGKPKVSEADVIELSVVRFLSDLPEVNTSEPLDGWEVPIARRAVAEAVMRDVESRPAQPPPTSDKPKARVESVAQRREREAKEHAAKLAESDVMARAVGREDIEYDLDNVVHRSAVVMTPRVEPGERKHYEVVPRKVKSLTRPCGTMEAKRRREQ